MTNRRLVHVHRARLLEQSIAGVVPVKIGVLCRVEPFAAGHCRRWVLHCCLLTVLTTYKRLGTKHLSISQWTTRRTRKAPGALRLTTLELSISVSVTSVLGSSGSDAMNERRVWSISDLAPPYKRQSMAHDKAICSLRASIAYHCQRLISIVHSQLLNE